MDLLEHEVGIAVLADRLHIPVCGFQFLFHRLTEGIIDMHAVAAQHSDLLVFQQVVVSGVFNDCRHIRCDKAFALAHADDQRTFTADSIHLIRMVSEDDAQRIGTLQVTDHIRDGLDGAAVIAIVQQLCHHLGIRIAGKGHALGCQVIFQFLIVLDDAVMYDGHSAAAVGMRVHVRRLAVGRPACMTDAHIALRSALTLHFVLQVFQSALGLGYSDLSILEHGDTGGVIATVFQLAQSVYQNVCAVPLSYISNNSTHILCLTFIQSQARAMALTLHTIDYTIKA